jgi:hypothetical protein
MEGAKYMRLCSLRYEAVSPHNRLHNLEDDRDGLDSSVLEWSKKAVTTMRCGTHWYATDDVSQRKTRSSETSRPNWEDCINKFFNKGDSRYTLAKCQLLTKCNLPLTVKYILLLLLDEVISIQSSTFEHAKKFFRKMALQFWLVEFFCVDT